MLIYSIQSLTFFISDSDANNSITNIVLLEYNYSARLKMSPSCLIRFKQRLIVVSKAVFAMAQFASLSLTKKSGIMVKVVLVMAGNLKIKKTVSLYIEKMTNEPRQVHL